MNLPDFTPDAFERIKEEAARYHRERDGEKELAALLMMVNKLFDEANNPMVDNAPAFAYGTEKTILQAAAFIIHKRATTIKNEIRQTGNGQIKVS